MKFRKRISDQKMILDQFANCDHTHKKNTMIFIYLFFKSIP